MRTRAHTAVAAAAAAAAAAIPAAPRRAATAAMAQAAAQPADDVCEQARRVQRNCRAVTAATTLRWQVLRGCLLAQRRLHRSGLAGVRECVAVLAQMVARGY